MKKKRNLFILAVLFICMNLYACSGSDENPDAEATVESTVAAGEESDDTQKEVYDIAPSEQNYFEGLTKEEITIEIPNISREYTFIYLSDLHIIAPNYSVLEEHKENVDFRYSAFINDEGEHAYKLWEKLPAMINATNADGILFGGDMIDYASREKYRFTKDWP